MFPSRRATSLVVAASVALALTACSSGASADPASPDEASVQYGWLQPSPLGLPVQTALDQGFFADNALAVSTVALKSGPELVSGVISNSTNIAIVPTDGALGAMSTGQDLVALPPFVQMNLDLVANPEAAPNGAIADLKGKVIGVVALGAIQERFARVVLEDAGLDPDTDVTFLAVGVGPSALAAYQHGQVDALVQSPAAHARFRAAGSDVVVLASSVGGTAGEIGAQGLIGFNVASRDFVEQNTSTIDAWCSAMTSTVDWLHDPANKDAALEELGTVVALEPDVAEPAFDAEALTVTMTITPEQWDYNRELAGVNDGLSFDSVVHSCS